MHAPSNLHYINALPPVADAFASTAISDVIKVDGAGIEFLVYRGVGTTGTSTVTVLACDDVTPSNTTAVTFWYKEITSDPGDTSWTLTTTSGFTTTAGSNAMFRIWVPADLIGANGYNYAQLSMAESVDAAVLGGILAILHEPKVQPVEATVIT